MCAGCRWVRVVVGLGWDWLGSVVFKARVGLKMGLLLKGYLTRGLGLG